MFAFLLIPIVAAISLLASSRAASRGGVGSAEAMPWDSDDADRFPLKVQLTMRQEEAITFAWIRGKLGFQKNTEVLSLGMDLLYWAVKAKLQGYELAAYKEGDGRMNILTNRHLDRLTIQAQGPPEHPTTH
jgi:hypothetical protein